MSHPPPQFWQAVSEFNREEFYACHDTLESLWMEADQSERNFYQGILQIAVACYHLGNQNQRGAMILLGEGINRLQPYCPTYANLDLETFLSQSAELLAGLQASLPVPPLHLPQLRELTP